MTSEFMLLRWDMNLAGVCSTVTFNIWPSLLIFYYCIVGKFGMGKVWCTWINRSPERLLIITTNMDGCSLANHGWFAKLSSCQTILLYGIFHHKHFTYIRMYWLLPYEYMANCIFKGELRICMEYSCTLYILMLYRLWWEWC